MALNLDKIRKKLLDSQSKGKKDFWKPKKGTTTHIRLVPLKDGTDDPFKLFALHYNVGKANGFLCPKRNYDEHCPVCELASKLWEAGDPDSRKMAKDFFAKERYFSAILVRGEEDRGVKWYGYSKTAYEDFLKYALDSDYGDDVTDVKTGHDFKIEYVQPEGQQFPSTDVKCRPIATSICDTGLKDDAGKKIMLDDKKCTEMLKKIPSIESLLDRKTPAEVQAILDDAMDLGGEEGDAEGTSTEKDHLPPKGSTGDAIDDAFNELLPEDK